VEVQTMSQRNTGQSVNPWKIAVLVGGGIVLALAAAGVVTSVVQNDDASSGRAVASAQAPPQALIEDCNQYAAGAQRDHGKILKDGAVGGAVGAGLGAAGGAIADGGDGAGKGAGIGAIVGAATGTLFGLNEENRRTEAARDAYRDCMARNGY
jgi:hypothetical protein